MVKSIQINGERRWEFDAGTYLTWFINEGGGEGGENKERGRDYSTLAPFTWFRNYCAMIYCTGVCPTQFNVLGQGLSAMKLYIWVGTRKQIAASSYNMHNYIRKLCNLPMMEKRMFMHINTGFLCWMLLQ